MGDDRVDVGVTERMLLENLELTRTGCLAVVHEVQERLGALSREAGAQRRNSIKAWQAEQLERKDIVRGKENAIQVLTSDQAQCAALAEQWRAKHDMQVYSMPCHVVYAPVFGVLRHAHGLAGSGEQHLTPSSR